MFLSSFLASNSAYSLKSFLDDRDRGTGFTRVFECSRLEDQFKIAAVKQLLLCLESPGGTHAFVTPVRHDLLHLVDDWRSILNDFGLLHTASLSSGKLLIAFCGADSQPTTILLRSLEQANRLRGLELASAVLYTAGDPYCRFSQSVEWGMIRGRVRSGNCPQVAVVGTKPF